MKSNLKIASRLTPVEDDVIQRAFNFAHSIAVGDYHLPQSMNYTMNNLADAVWKLAQAHGISIADSCSGEYMGFREGCKKGLDEKLKKTGE